MLESCDLTQTLTRETYRQRWDALEPRLGELQRATRERGIPVVLVFEGWDAVGKGTAISRLVHALDPRGYRVHPTNAPTEDEALRPPLWRFWLKLPPRGSWAIYDRSWYGQVLVERVDKRVPKRQWRWAYESIRRFERQLVDNGNVVVKFWLHMSKQEQAKRLKALEKDPVLAWKVTKEDRRRHKQYGDYLDAVENMIAETSAPDAPWTVIPAHDKRFAAVTIGDHVVRTLEAALTAEPSPAGALPALDPAPDALADVDVTATLDRPTYEKRLPRLQRRLQRLEHAIYTHRVPVVIVYEGWDASGKGGSIRRMTRELDPRGYEVIPVAAPEGDEKKHHYLWRFWRHLPKAGHMTLFDRSWYGRLLVERVEGFATPEEWGRAYREINEFEEELTRAGTALVKFWFHISAEEQLQRFQSRQTTPEKQWKITEEDWRNREKWDAYYAAVSDMIARTSTPQAPWTVIEGNDKLHARIKALRVVCKAIEDKLGGRLRKE